MTSIQPNAPTNTQTIVQPKQPEAKSKEKSSISTGVKVAVGTGLTALAAAGIYIATKGKGGKNVKNLGEEIKSLTQACNHFSKLFEFETPQISESLKEISKLPKKEQIGALQQLKTILDHANVVINHIDLEQKLPKGTKLSLPKGMTTLPDDVRQAYEQKDVIKTGELFKQHLDKLPNTRPAVTKGATVAESIENTFGKGSNIQPHTYDLSKEHSVITIYRDQGGYKDGTVSKEGRYYNDSILNENIPDSKFAIKSNSFSAQGCENIGKGKCDCYDAVLTIDGEKRRIVRIVIPDPVITEDQGRSLWINLLSPNEELTPAQKDFLKLGKNPEKIDVSVFDKLTTVAETRQDMTEGNLYKYLDYDVLLSAIQSMAKQV